MNINTPPDKIAEYLDKNFYQDDGIMFEILKWNKEDINKANLFCSKVIEKSKYFKSFKLYPENNFIFPTFFFENYNVVGMEFPEI